MSSDAGQRAQNRRTCAALLAGIETILAAPNEWRYVCGDKGLRFVGGRVAQAPIASVADAQPAYLYITAVHEDTRFCRKSGGRMEPCRVQGLDGSGSSGTMRPRLCRIWAPRRSGEIAALAARGMPVSLAVAMLAASQDCPAVCRSSWSRRAVDGSRRIRRTMIPKRRPPQRRASDRPNDSGWPSSRPPQGRTDGITA